MSTAPPRPRGTVATRAVTTGAVTTGAVTTGAFVAGAFVTGSLGAPGGCGGADPTRLAAGLVAVTLPGGAGAAGW